MKTVLPSFIFVVTALWSYALNAQDSPFGDHYWIIASSTISPAMDIDFDGKPDTDLRILTPECEQDDAERYHGKGIIITNRGNIHCEEDEEHIEEIGNWSYDEKTKKLKMEKYDSSNEVVAFLESISPSEIVFVSKHRSATGTHSIRTTLRPQKK